jgi:hypothetical protein
VNCHRRILPVTTADSREQLNYLILITEQHAGMA